MEPHGGKRAGAGRPKGSTTDHSQRFSKARADKEHALARLRKMEADLRAGELVTSQYHINVVHVIGGVLKNRLGHLHHRIISMAPGLSREAVEELRKAIRIAHEEVAHAVLDELQKFSDKENQNAK